MKTAVFVFAILIGPMSAPAGATGCSWTESLEVGASRGTEALDGRFRCQAFRDGFYCHFETEPKGRPFVVPSYGLHAAPPFAGELVRVEVEHFEAMEWMDCDGSDPVPPFAANRLLSSFAHEGVEYRRVQALPESP